MATRSNPEGVGRTTSRGDKQTAARETAPAATQKAPAAPATQQAPATPATETVAGPPPVGPPAASPPTSRATTPEGERPGATLKVCVQVLDAEGEPENDCMPSADQIQVFYGDTELTPLEPSGDCFVGSYDLDNVMVDVVAESFTCQSSGQRYDPSIDRTAILLTRGRTAELTLTYLPGSAAIQITPRLVERELGHGPPGTDYRASYQPDQDADYGTGKYGKEGGAPRSQPIPGVRFRLFDGPAGSGKPLERVTTVGRPTVSFTDLDPGDKTLVVDAPRRFKDRPIELRNARYTSYRFQLGAGQSLILDSQFEFEPAAGGVTVQVVDHRDDRRRIDGVVVRLVPVSGGSEPGLQASDAAGVATFASVSAGTYRVELAVDPTQVDGTTWVASASPIVTVTAEDSTATVELRLVEDRHLVQGTVFGPDGKPLPHALVEILQAPDDETRLDIAVTDEQGRYEWEAPHAGTFYLAVVQQDGRARRVVPVGVHSVAKRDLYVDGSPPAGGGTPSGGQPGTEEDPTPFPLLVGNVDLTAGTAPTRGSGGGYGGGYGGSGYGYDSGGSAGATVSAAIRDVLGYRSRTTDTKGFVAALQRSFTCKEMTGYTVCTWTPRSYASTIPADLGALTGAQASIYERAKVTVDATLPLLDGLTPLLSDADDEDVEAIRAIVRSRLTEIVAELSLEGGPRIQRVDELFERLTEQLPSTDPKQVVLVDVNNLDGELRILGERFGMLRQEVNTIAEEENFTNFLIIVDSVATLFVSWQQTRAFFDRAIAIENDPNDQNAPFLGTQLVLISRQLNVVSETVKETYFAMDSVFLGPAERQTVLLKLTDEGNIATTILLSELLDWVDRFVTDEGPQLIEEAGTDGVNAFVPTIARLATLVESATKLRNDPLIPPTFFTGRVQLALGQLAGQLRGAANLALAVFDRLKVDDVPPPVPPKTDYRNMVRGGRR